ncbi:hypothetical protein [Spiroplasma taiwanense]|uniref:Uncharacterized protein n=1 Tax=Spiroplasma taiwanense CT-1 TaxID=1276220 RepID=S5M075_9MOLU|nr:hypothetical protein [Spiroplasma taiwanense]AGR41402.1 hypothetical protein STAIW_v1c08140 [Spiroplasma taiwanense CT-1]
MLDLFNIQTKDNKFDPLLAKFNILIIGELNITLGTLSSLIFFVPLLKTLNANLGNNLDIIRNLNLSALAQLDPSSQEEKEQYLEF